MRAWFSDDTQERDHGLLFWLFVAGVLLRGFLGASLLDRLDGYSHSGGSLLTRVSPGTYLLLLAAALAAARPVRLGSERLVRPALLLAAVALIGAVWAAATGSLVSMGALFDLYLPAAAALFALTRLSLTERESILRILAVALGLNAAVLLAEFVLHKRLVTQAFLEMGAAFRPAAALDHPLLNGLIYATAAPVLATLRGPLMVKVLLAGVAVFAAVIAGARVATLVALLAFPVIVITTVRSEPREAEDGRRWIGLVLAASLVPVVVAAAFGLGLAHRFAGGLVDDSALKRVRDFQMLAYLTPHQWRFGGAASDLQDWSLRLFKGASVESPVVSAVFMFGAPMAALLGMLIVAALVDLARACSAQGRLALLAFGIIAASNNTLVVKNPSLMFAVVLAGVAAPAARRGLASVALEPVSFDRARRRPARTRRAPPTAAL